jgi:DNA-binding MarR family transcriptional regulator
MTRIEEHPLIVPSLERATHAVGLRLEQSLQELGITQAEAHILGALAEVRECSINDLHASFGHKRSTLTSILDRLEGRGLIVRAPHPTSRRSVMIRLTEYGEEVAERVTGILRSIEEAVAGRVSADDLHGFRRVVAAIESSGGPGDT